MKEVQDKILNALAEMSGEDVMGTSRTTMGPSCWMTDSQST